MSKKFPDPVKICKVHKTIGCSHVDGMLCDPNACREKLELDLWELEEQLDIPHRLRYYKTIK